MGFENICFPGPVLTTLKQQQQRSSAIDWPNEWQVLQCKNHVAYKVSSLPDIDLTANKIAEQTATKQSVPAMTKFP